MLRRFWVYQREGFPLLNQGCLIAVITWCGVSFSLLARHAVNQTAALHLLTSSSFVLTFLVAFVSTLGFFLQLRMVAEDKVYSSDWPWQPYRVASRGLSLPREWPRWVGLLMAVQLALAFWLDEKLILPLLLVWSYLGLMREAFFIHKWLKLHPLAYLLARGVIIPLIFLYITACDWLVNGAAPPPGLFWFLVAGFFSGMIFEIGYKIRAPQDEESGLETYSKLWGRRTAVTTWLLAVALTGMALTIAAEPLRTGVLMLALATSLLTGAVLIGERFLRTPLTLYAGSIKQFSDLYTFLLYLSLVLMPLCLI